MRKGISPLIAAVMLIAFVISIGGLFAEWSGSLTTDATEKNTDEQQQILDCTSMQIEIVEVGENYADGNLDVTLRSDNGAVGNITVRAFPSLNSNSVQLDSAGQVKIVSINASSSQDFVRANSQRCNMQTTEDLE